MLSRKLIADHIEGIIAYATFKRYVGKVGGINRKIKALLRHGYGYPDDEYFFMKAKISTVRHLLPFYESDLYLPRLQRFI